MIPLVTASEAGRAQTENRWFTIELWSMDALSANVPGLSSLEQDVKEGENPVFGLVPSCTMRILRVELLGSAALSGW